MSLTNDEVRQILKLIEESGYDDVRLETGDFKLHVQKHGSRDTTFRPPAASDNPASREPLVDHIRNPPKAGSQSPATPPPPTTESIPEGVVAIRSPMLGTFFRAPSPGEAPFVNEGSKVTPGDTVCLVEVMKLFNSVKSGVSGKVIKICAENGKMVEYDEILMLIEEDRTAPAK